MTLQMSEAGAGDMAQCSRFSSQHACSSSQLSVLQLQHPLLASVDTRSADDAQIQM